MAHDVQPCTTDEGDSSPSKCSDQETEPPEQDVQAAETSDELLASSAPHDAGDSNESLGAERRYARTEPNDDSTPPDASELTFRDVLSVVPDDEFLSRRADEYICDHGAKGTLETLSRAVSSLPSALVPHLCRSSLAALDQTLPLSSPHWAEDCEALGTGCAPLDQLLGGGLVADGGALYEISGPAGAGKTQVAMQVCAAAARAGGSAIYACTEGAPPMARLAALCGSEVAARYVYVERLRTSEHLLQWAGGGRLAYMVRTFTPRVRVIVVDSVAAVYRAEFSDAGARAAHLTALARALRQPCGVVVVCINQVSQAPDRVSGELSATIPALGGAWSALVDTRIFITRVRGCGGSGGRRCASILSSSYLPSDGRKAYFRITGDGVVQDNDYD